MDEEKQLRPYLGVVGAWALALGTSIGWGSLVITSSTYLAQAGPAGSVAGMAVGALIMIVISRNYHYMMNTQPEAGGAYTYTRNCFGADQGFLAAWFLALTYLAMLWANATAIPLFARYFIGDVFEFVKLYSLFGYDVYLGEILLTLAAILAIALLCTGRKKLTASIMIALVICFAAAVTICFGASMASHGQAFSPAFVPDSSAVSQIMAIALISPWAFIGFENISHASEEFSFNRQKSFRVLVVSVVTTTLLYVFITLLSATAYPAPYDSWFSYIQDLGQLSGIEALPAFYAAQHYLGPAGVGLLMAALLALVITSLIGNIVALSRLFYSLSKDRVLPPRFAELNAHNVPSKAVLLIACISLVIPFLGRTAIGWIVDVTTIGATLVYAIVSACTYKQAKEDGAALEKATGLVGLVIMIAFEAYLLIPNLFTTGSMATETYFLFVAWSVLGFMFFRLILSEDEENRFGRSIIVWIALLSLILFVSLVWMSQSVMGAASDGISAVEAYYAQPGIQADIGISAQQMDIVRSVNARSMVVVVVLFGVALGVLLNNYTLMSRRAVESEARLDVVQKLYTTDPLTGVKSKHAYADKEHKINSLLEAGTSEPFAVVVCDVNGLKHVNDTFGHKAGDEYIRNASRMICGLFVHSPVYRTGGDEFVVILQGGDYENRMRIIEILHEMSVTHIHSDEVVVAAGMSDYNSNTDSALHDVFERADALMYEEKNLLKELGAKTR